MPAPLLCLQLCVIDGESWSEAAPNVFKNVRRLLKSDEVQSRYTHLMHATANVIQCSLRFVPSQHAAVLSGKLWSSRDVTV